MLYRNFLQVFFALTMGMSIPLESRAQFVNEAIADYTVIKDGRFELSGDIMEDSFNFEIPSNIVLDSPGQLPVLTFKLDGERGSQLTIIVLINNLVVRRFTVKGDTFQTFHEVVNGAEGHLIPGAPNLIQFKVVPGPSRRREPEGGFGVKPRRSLFISDVVLWYQRDRND